ncbi:MAG: HAMP domain-containing histidine kinase [Acidobacteria bacterium]|nr:HAMP domain-containing histidine kinase [Acidobacteriota bacterium]
MSGLIEHAGQSSQGVAGAGAGQLQALGAEVVNLLHEQAFTFGEGLSEAEICRAFSDILLSHWELCCIITFLRGDDGRLQQSAAYTHPHLDEEKARLIGQLVSGEVEATGAECYLWADDARAAEADAVTRKLLGFFEQTNLRAAVGVPIYAHGRMTGVLVVLSAFPDILRAALKGIRFVGPAIIIAIGNARRAAAMVGQRRQIESLFEELRQRSAALEEANLELHRVSRYRSLFLQRMSHELRTPLTSILGFTEILLDHERLTDTQQHFCEKIQGSGFQLQTSLDQLVDLSRLEAGQTELFLHEFSLRETLRETCAAVARLAQKQDVKLECNTAPELVPIVSDEGKLRQVLYNFFAHAIGRTPAGGTVKICAAPAEENRFRIEISDEGQPLQDPAHLFDPAVDVDAPNECGTNMNELGLVIANRLLGVLGGSVSLHEIEPAGLAVRLNLPARPRDESNGE